MNEKDLFEVYLKSVSDANTKDGRYDEATVKTQLANYQSLAKEYGVEKLHRVFSNHEDALQMKVQVTKAKDGNYGVFFNRYYEFRNNGEKLGKELENGR